MQNTKYTLARAAHFLNILGLHTGDQFAARHVGLDVCAAIYVAAENDTFPEEFTTDEVASIRLIESSADAMTAIRALSAVLDSEPCETEIAPGHTVPDYIEHVSNWAATAPIGATEPPTKEQVIDRILRAADIAALETPVPRPGHTDAWGICRTCSGHGTVITGNEEIPYAQLSRRRRQGHDRGHRFTRPVSKPCTDCDGRDRATDDAVSAHEATL